MSVYLLSDELIFPDPELSNEDGLLAVGGDLSVERLLLAYSNGIFPWYSKEPPILWWSPDPRMVLFPEKMKISKSLKSIINKNKFQVKFDVDFEKVIKCCADVRRKNEESTWITDDMINAYVNLHLEGFAHSVEAYYNGELVGGLYGVSLGKAFFGESMFHYMNDASKVALYLLVEKLKSLKFEFIDVQQDTKHLKSLGAELISRKVFLSILQKSLKHETIRGKW